MTKNERLRRILARGETSNHCHVVCGNEVTVCEEEKGSIMVTVGNAGAVLRHLIEDQYTETGVETWTKEHVDIPLPAGTYKFVPQMEFNPYDATVKKVQD